MENPVKQKSRATRGQSIKGGSLGGQKKKKKQIGEAKTRGRDTKISKGELQS